jgi:hypothetical protein
MVYTYSFFGREITKYTVIYGVYIRFWPTLTISAQRECLPTSAQCHNLGVYCGELVLLRACQCFPHLLLLYFDACIGIEELLTLPSKLQL